MKSKSVERYEKNATMAARSVLTLKLGSDTLMRSEYEYEIPPADAEELMKACGLNKIAKTRYICPHKGQNWEVDVFHEANEGLVMAEIELTAANEVISKPDWLLDEVTGDSKYQNANLAVKPFKNWHIEQ